MSGGAVEEVRTVERALSERGRLEGLTLDGIALPALKAHGVPELRAYLGGAMSRDDAVARAVLNTGQYAKRQMTWARHQINSDFVVSETDNYQMVQMTKFLDKIEG